MRLHGYALALAAPLLLAGMPVQDNDSAAETGALSLKDGRFLFGKPIERKKGGVVVKFAAGDVFVPDALIQDCFSSSTNFQYEPKNDSEKKKLEKGLVPFQGRWIKKSAAERAIQKLQEDLKERIETQKEYKLWRNRRKVETKTFRFEHNLPEELFDKLQYLMEVYYKNFTKYWGKKTKLPNKPTINLYADQGDFEQISGASRGILGWYHLLSNQLHVFWDRTDPELTIDVLFHEANHMLSDMINGKFRYDRWIEEAMAEYYGASRWDEKKKKMSVGHLQAARLQEVKSGIARDKWMKLDELIGSQSYSSYTWGWTFVHFMMETPKYQKKWKKFYLALAHGNGIKRGGYGPFRTCEADEQRKQLMKVFRLKELKSLEKEWHAYIKRLEIQDVTGLEQAGRKLRTMGKYDEAKKYFEQAVAKGAKNPFTYAAYADVLYKGKEQRQALEMIDKAIELDPLEPDFYYKKGKILERSGKTKKDALTWYKLAAEIDPESWTYAAAAADV